MKNPEIPKKLIRTVRLDEAKLTEVLDRLDRNSGTPGEDRRDAVRYPFRRPACTAFIQQPGDSSPTAFQVPTRNLGSGGVSFLHGGYLHQGTRVIIQLLGAFGAWGYAKGGVIQCRFIESGIFEVCVAFDEPISTSDYCPDAMSLRVLLAEDDSSTSRLAKYLLGQLNATVDHAENGHKAYEMAKAQAYDLILMDVEMSEMDGMAVVKRLRSEGYAGRIMAVTALDRPADRERCMEMGCNGFLAKPYSKQQLSDLILSMHQEPIRSSLIDDPAIVPLVDQFVEELPAKLRKIDEAFRASDLEQLSRLVRRLKGDGGSYGFAPLASAAGEVETCLQGENPLESLKKQMEELSKICSMIRPTVEKKA